MLHFRRAVDSGVFMRIGGSSLGVKRTAGDARLGASRRAPPEHSGVGRRQELSDGLYCSGVSRTYVDARALTVPVPPSPCARAV